MFYYYNVICSLGQDGIGVQQGQKNINRSNIGQLGSWWDGDGT